MRNQKQEAVQDDTVFEFTLSFSMLKCGAVMFLLGGGLGGLVAKKFFSGPTIINIEQPAPAPAAVPATIPTEQRCPAPAPAPAAVPAATAPAQHCPQCQVCPSSPDVNFQTPKWWQVGENEMIRRSYDVRSFQNPRIVPLQNILRPKDCQFVIREGSKQKFRSGRVINPKPEHKDDKAWTDEEGAQLKTTRVVELSVLDRTDPKWRWLYQRVLKSVNNLNDRYWHEKIPTNVDSEMFESLQFYIYNSSTSGHYSWHSDTGIEGLTARRRLSVVLIIGDPNTYEGGDFQIQASAKTTTILAEQGMMYVFPSYVLHRVTPVTKGVRYVAVSWIQVE
mmetsp:Transcript_34339/g.67642  ORF Transcript_34339/g.67642 Transcript_34339/m.67642 type:complete len:334 (-) Transcript_34339:2678-3679(-)